MVIFLDEVSMVGTDKLTTINLRMQDIMGNNEFMGGVSLVCTGDFGQLPPVKEKMIWSKSYLDGRIDVVIMTFCWHKSTRYGHPK